MNRFIAVWIDSICKNIVFQVPRQPVHIGHLSSTLRLYILHSHPLWSVGQAYLSLTPIYLSLLYIHSYKYISTFSLTKRKERERDGGSGQARIREEKNRDEKRPRRRGKSNWEDLYPRSSSKLFGTHTRNRECLNSHTIDIWCLYTYVMKIR